jgi:predicted transcriptional regulator with HTH domain
MIVYKKAISVSKYNFFVDKLRCLLYKFIQGEGTVLKSLFSSSIRADVLSLLLNSPDEQFYIREIAKLLRKNPSGIKRELDNLEKMGIVTSEKIVNLRYFQANKESPLFSELKNLMGAPSTSSSSVHHRPSIKNSKTLKEGLSRVLTVRLWRKINTE